MKNSVSDTLALSPARMYDAHLSADCVLIGFDGEDLCVLLVRRMGVECQGGEVEFKLPGSLLFTDEGPDEAAQRIVREMTGLKNIELHQFYTFGSPTRILDPKDVKWLTHYYTLNAPVQRLASVAYTALIKIEKRHRKLNNSYEACWVPLHNVGNLAFDHNQIMKTALKYIRKEASLNVDILFSLMPKKFTAAQMRRVFEVVFNHDYDIRNFHKLIAKMKNVVPTEEFEEGVSHRAARYYKFTKTKTIS